jgi:hypothetical protein
MHASTIFHAGRNRQIENRVILKTNAGGFIDQSLPPYAGVYAQVVELVGKSYWPESDERSRPRLFCKLNRRLNPFCAKKA